VNKRRKREGPKVQTKETTPESAECTMGSPFFHLLECFLLIIIIMFGRFFTSIMKDTIIDHSYRGFTYMRECAISHSCSKGNGSKNIYRQVLIRKSENNDRYLFFSIFINFFFLVIYIYIMLCVGIAYLPRQGSCRAWIQKTI
jgi:hypothetical protein